MKNLCESETALDADRIDYQSLLKTILDRKISERERKREEGVLEVVCTILVDSFISLVAV